MVEKELGRLHKKLDDIITANQEAHVMLVKDIGKSNLLLTRLEEHQRSINGSMVELKKESIINSCNIKENKESIVFAKGGIYVIGFLTSVIGLVTASKVFGLW